MNYSSGLDKLSNFFKNPIALHMSKDDDDGKLQVGLLARRHQTATAAQTAAQLQPGDKKMSAQSTPRPHCHRIHLSGQEKY